MPLTTEEVVRKASAARSAKARTRRFQRYLREMRAAGLTVAVSRVTSAEDYAYNMDPAALPEER